MRQVYDDLDGYEPEPLPKALRTSLGRPLVLRPDGAVVFTGWVKPTTSWEHTPTLTAVERWCNDVWLDSTRLFADPLWRPQLLTWGLIAANDLLDRATLFPGAERAQVHVRLAPGPYVGLEPDSEQRAGGTVKLYCVRGPDDDLSPAIRDEANASAPWAQPQLVLSAGGVD